MTDKEKLNKLKELADKMAHSSEYLVSDASYLHKAVYEYRQFIIQHWDEEEPANEDLDEAAENHALQCYSKEASTATLAASKYDFIAGANWQKEKLLKDSESAEIGYWNQRGLSIRLDKDLEELGFGEDTKVKVLIIKEEEK